LSKFKISSAFRPAGDQPKAIIELSDGIKKGAHQQTLLGVTGSGKTFTMACVIEKIQKPTLVIAHNKTLAAQLATEFKEFFPDNAVEYFVSYYDYYQPEAYLPRTDTYIEKDSSINDELDKLRHSATRSLLTRNDVLIVASVSCIFGLGSPDEYQSFVIEIKKGDTFVRSSLISQLIDMQYERNDYDLSRGKFRVKGDTIDILPVYEELGIRVQFWGDEIETIIITDPLTGEILSEKIELSIYPAKHFVTSEEKLKLAIKSIQSELSDHLDVLKNNNQLLEAQRLESRTNYDLEMLEVAGYCAGVENYSRHLSQRDPGSTPHTLMDYLPDNFLLFADESHMTLPQIRAMYHGDRSRKKTLVEHGFRLPSALDNRPLNFDEFNNRISQVIYVSATPSEYEIVNSSNVVEQIIRPTGLLDPVVVIKPVEGQIDDLINEIKIRVTKKERCLITTLTKRMSEELSDYLKESGIKTNYLHSEIDTLERIAILRDLRNGIFDVIVGINLLREGLDLPEVSLVAIIDADKEGYLRSSTALIQTIGRASRHADGKVIMYADRITKSMKYAIDETNRRRELQKSHNLKNNITPQTIKKNIRDLTERITSSPDTNDTFDILSKDIPKEEIGRMIKGLEKQMKAASKNLEFEKAGLMRDEIIELRKIMII
jgi:excinuclease ABC subunit B|tara:strand:- start:118 stop:2094 length:1977 start_codon:yes stop_codon:yes gene_type:complete